jgi:hypothetical protein
MGVSFMLGDFRSRAALNGTLAIARQPALTVT